MSRRPAAIGGFTLLEVLVATALVTMLAGALYASLYIAFKARRSAVSAVETVRKVDQSVELLKADLQSAVLTNSTLASSFIGTGSGGGSVGSQGPDLTFYAAATDIAPGADVGVGDLKKIEYSLEPAADDGKLALVRRVTTNLLAPITVMPQPEIICRNVAAVSLSYFDGTDWLDNWDSTTQNTTQSGILPKAVKVTINLASDNGTGQQVQMGSAVSRVLAIPCSLGSSSVVTSSSVSSLGGGL